MTTQADSNTIQRPVLTFSTEVGTWVREHYDAASVILEYGSGGSTVMASEMPNKTVFSVESDPRWCLMVQKYIESIGSTSDVTMHYANIGDVGAWGRPVSDTGWASYHRYPNSVWDLRTFNHPDLVLVDGRFRVACALTALLRAERPLTLLFDDYVERKGYHAIEKFMKPVETRGSMARFEIEPQELPRSKLTQILQFYTNPY